MMVQLIRIPAGTSYTNSSGNVITFTSEVLLEVNQRVRNYHPNKFVCSLKSPIYGIEIEFSKDEADND